MLLNTQMTLDYADADVVRPMATADSIATPEGYKGLAAFHKYWGKKPVECLAFLIELLTEPGELVLDPFVGSGFVGREAVLRERRFIGIDINPVAVELSRLLLNLPDMTLLRSALCDIEARVRDRINDTYCMADGSFATHYLWNREELQSVWQVGRGKGGRKEALPMTFDLEQFQQYEGYASLYPRRLRSYHNSRINTTDDLTFDHLFTGCARHNIDLLLRAIHCQPVEAQNALLLSLTSASGQMSRMVFAITGRGKTTGTPSDKIEVGSWVIGYWRPRCILKSMCGTAFRIAPLDW